MQGLVYFILPTIRKIYGTFCPWQELHIKYAQRWRNNTFWVYNTWDVLGSGVPSNDVSIAQKTDLLMYEMNIDDLDEFKLQTFSSIWMWHCWHWLWPSWHWNILRGGDISPLHTQHFNSDLIIHSIHLLCCMI